MAMDRRKKYNLHAMSFQESIKGLKKLESGFSNQNNDGSESPYPVEIDRKRIDNNRYFVPGGGDSEDSSGLNDYDNMRG